MKEILNHLGSDIIIDGDNNIQGILSVNILVTDCATLYVYGIVNGQVTIAEKATMIVHGTINGNIINDGNCKIFGTVNGKLIKQLGEYSIDNKASINDN